MSRNIDINIRQTFDADAAKRSAQAVQEAAKENAEAITRIEEEESQKRIAIAEQEAEAITRARNSVPAAVSPAAPAEPPPPEAPGSTGAPLAEHWLPGLQRLQEALGHGDDNLREWNTELDYLQGELEHLSGSLEVGSEQVTDFGARVEELQRQMRGQREGMQLCADTSAALSAALAAGELDSQTAAKAWQLLEVRGQQLGARMNALRPTFAALRQEMRQAMQGIESPGKQATAAIGAAKRAAKEAGESSVESSVESASQIQRALGALGGAMRRVGQTATSVTGGIRKGFIAASKSVQMLRTAINKVTWTMALINQAWELCSKVWDWMKGRSEAAAEAEKQHAEAMKELREEAEEAAQAAARSAREQKAMDVYRTMAENLRLVNKELERSVALKNQDIALDLRRKRLHFDRQEWQLEEEEQELEAEEEEGRIDAEEASQRRADLEHRRVDLRREREDAERRARREGLNHEATRLRAGIAEAQHTKTAAEAIIKADDIRWLTPGEMRARRALSLEGQLEGPEAARYETLKGQVRRLLNQQGMADMYEAWYRGDMDLPGKLREVAEAARQQMETYEERLERTVADIEEVDWEAGTADEQTQREHRRVSATAMKRTRQARKVQSKKEMQEEVDDDVEEAAVRTQKAKEAAAGLHRENEQRIEVRLRERTEEKGIEELYKAVREAGDLTMLRRIRAELQRDWRQVTRGERGWSGEQLKRYQPANIAAMTRLRGKDREFWGETFGNLEQSMQLEEGGRKLSSATEKFRKAARDHASTLGEVSAKAVDFANAFQEDREALQRLGETLAELRRNVKTMQNQNKHRRTIGR